MNKIDNWSVYRKEELIAKNTYMGLNSKTVFFSYCDEKDEIELSFSSRLMKYWY